MADQSKQSSISASNPQDAPISSSVDKKRTSKSNVVAQRNAKPELKGGAKSRGQNRRTSDSLLRGHVDSDGFKGPHPAVQQAAQLGMYKFPQQTADAEVYGGFKYHDRAPRNSNKTAPKTGGRQEEPFRKQKSVRSERSNGSQQEKLVNGKSGVPNRRAYKDDRVFEFAMTEWYVAARDAGFRSVEALARFNANVAVKAHLIDPIVSRFNDCEHDSDGLVLCECYVRKAVAVEAAPEMSDLDPTPVNPVSRTAMRATQRVVQSGSALDDVKSVLKKFAPASFDIDSMNNPNLPREHVRMDDSMIIHEMYWYIRLEMQTNYEVNGVWQREVQLAHAMRLARTWLKEKKLAEISHESFLKCVNVTVQKAVDQKMDSWQRAERNESYVGWDFRYWGSRVFRAGVFVCWAYVVRKVVWPRIPGVARILANAFFPWLYDSVKYGLMTVQSVATSAVTALNLINGSIALSSYLGTACSSGGSCLANRASELGRMLFMQTSTKWSQMGAFVVEQMGTRVETVMPSMELGVSMMLLADAGYVVDAMVNVPDMAIQQMEALVPLIVESAEEAVESTLVQSAIDMVGALAVPAMAGVASGTTLGLAVPILQEQAQTFLAALANWFSGAS